MPHPALGAREEAAQTVSVACAVSAQDFFH